MQLSDVVRIALIFSEDAKRYAKKLAGSIDLSGKADKKKPSKAGNLAALDASGNLTDSGKTDEEILKERKVLIADVYMKTHEEIEVIESFFESAPANATPLWYLGESLKLLGTADFAVFAPGWQDYRGCRIEHDAAVAYGIPIAEV